MARDSSEEHGSQQSAPAADGPRSRPGPGTRWQALAAIVLGLAVGLGVCEAGLRLWGFQYEAFAYRPDPDLGWVLLPHLSGYRHSESGWSYFSTNRAGMRDVEHPVSKPAGVYRIAVLGDSFAEDDAVSIRQSFWSVMERQLSKCPALSGRRSEVLNFGVDGYGVAQELLMLRERAQAYHPDAVVLAVCVGNDLLDNSPELDRYSAPRPHPYLHQSPSGLVMDTGFRRAYWFRFWGTRQYRLHVWLSDHLRLVQLLDYVRQLRAARRASEAGNDYGPVAEQWRDDAISGALGPPWRQTWHDFDAIIEQMARETAARQQLFLVVAESEANQVYPDLAVRAAYQRKYGIADLLSINRRIQALGARADIPVLDLGAPMQRYAEQHRVFLHGFGITAPPGYGHWNVAGNQLAGELIAARLCAMLGQQPHAN